MSLKPNKKSDHKKAWMKPRKDRKILVHPEYHLIVTEGTATEPLYFTSVKKIIDKRYPDKIQLSIYGEGDNTLSLFNKAKHRAETNPNTYRHVWLVYDTDDFPDDYVNRTVDLCNKYSTEETQYHAIWSNQCIELWYLLHFCYFQSDIHRSEYWDKLSQYLSNIGVGTYTKERPDMYEVLKPYMRTAIKNAKKLNEKNGEKYPSQAAPGTKVYEIIEKLYTYLSDDRFGK